MSFAHHFTFFRIIDKISFRRRKNSFLLCVKKCNHFNLYKKARVECIKCVLNYLPIGIGRKTSEKKKIDWSKRGRRRKVEKIQFRFLYSQQLDPFHKSIVCKHIQRYRLDIRLMIMLKSLKNFKSLHEKI